MKPSEYKKNKVKKVTLPSGLEVTIRKMTSPTYGLLMEKTNFGEDNRTKVVEAMKIIFPACVVSPKVVLGETDENDDTVMGIGDIDIEDGSFLITEIYEFSGIITAVKEAASFREDGDSQKSNAAGEDAPKTQ